MINILVTGDYYPGGRTEKLSLDEEHEMIFGDFLEEVRSSDLAITNLEAPLVEEESPLSKTGPVLKGKPACMDSLSFAGFDLITLANNHIMDYGDEGLDTTMSVAKQHGVSYVGAGKNIKEAQKSFFTEIEGVSIAVLNFAENEFSTTKGDWAGANPLDPIQNFKAIQAAKQKADYVLVITHGGHETYELPSPRMKATFRFFIEAGADAVVNHHTHRVSGYEVYRDKPIFYSLGNFIFDWPTTKPAYWYEGCAVKLSITKNTQRFELVPYSQNEEQIGIQKLYNTQSLNFYQKMEELNQVIADDAALQDAFEEYCGKSKRMYRAYLEPHSNRWIYALQARKWLPSFLTNRKKLLLLNLVRCEAHRDVLLHILKEPQ